MTILQNSCRNGSRKERQERWYARQPTWWMQSFSISRINHIGVPYRIVEPVRETRISHRSCNRNNGSLLFTSPLILGMRMYRADGETMPWPMFSCWMVSLLNRISFWRVSQLYSQIEPPSSANEKYRSDIHVPFHLGESPLVVLIVLARVLS